MDPFSAVVLVVSWFVARSAEEFAAEFGKDTYDKVKSLMTVLTERLSDQPDSDWFFEEAQMGEITQDGETLISKVLNEDENLFREFSITAEDITSKHQFRVEQDIDESDDVVGLKASDAITSTARVTQSIKRSNNIRGIDLT